MHFQEEYGIKEAQLASRMERFVQIALKIKLSTFTYNVILKLKH